MYAIFENGSHQFRVREGEKITIDRRPEDENTAITFDRVLLLAGGEGEPIIGTPLVEGARIEARILRQYRGKKIIIRKYKRRKGYRRKRGHRQWYCDVQITRIVTP